MKTAAEFLRERCAIEGEPSQITVNANDVIKAMIDFAHQQNDNISQIVPTELRIKEKALQELNSGEYDSYNSPQELYVAGAIWMRKMLIGK